MSIGLPAHGRVACDLCHRGLIPTFDVTRTGEDSWRITYNPLSWGNADPEVIVLGFSKGPTQAGALAREPHNSIAFKKGRTNLAKILHHVGLIGAPDSSIVDRLIADPHGRFHFGSLIRCTVERREGGDWKGTGGGMLDKFVQTPFGTEVARNCTRRFLGELPGATRLVVLLGMGSKMTYVQECRKLISAARPTPVRTVNAVAYADEQVVFVHTEHFAAQGALIPNWMSERSHERGRLGMLAREAVSIAMGTSA